MNVEQVIKELQKIKNKSLNVVVCINSTKEKNHTQFTNLNAILEYNDELELLGDYNNYEGVNNE
tara:strand:+ start:16205 stop:16396 length:192 start_codon:yes stop_codon:yes gene_type:complete